jgi:hypothetical protein
LSGIAVVVVAMALTGCVRFPVALPDPPASVSAQPEASPAPPVVADPEITVLTPDQVTAIPPVVKSEPAGSWTIGAGLPNGFPAGIPAFSDRWVEGNVFEFDSSGRDGLSVMFWGDYTAVDRVLAEFRNLGFDVVDETLETRRVAVAENDQYKVVVTATESAKLPGTDALIDPAYYYAIVSK